MEIGNHTISYSAKLVNQSYNTVFYNVTFNLPSDLPYGNYKLLRREMSRVLSGNPITDVLTEEERIRLKELIEKDELTLEEADELYKIADKLVEEYGDKYTEVWKLLWYSRFWIGYNLRKQREERKEEKRRD